MDKIKIATLGMPNQAENKIVEIGDAQIEITPIIPYEKMLEMVQWCVSIILDDRPYISEPVRQVVEDFAILKYYTNLEIPMDQPEFDLSRMYEDYDLLLSHDVIETVIRMISQRQFEMFRTHLYKTLTSIMEYRNSAAGLIDKLSAMAKSDTNAINDALSTLTDPEKLQQVNHLMEIVDKLGTPQGGEESKEK